MTDAPVVCLPDDDPTAYERRTAEHTKQFVIDLDHPVWTREREANERMRGVFTSLAFDADIDRTAPKLDRWAQEILDG